MRALVLSGGSALGAYQVGVLKYAAHVLGLTFNAAYGVSVGALNAGKIVMLPQESVRQAVDELEHLWLTMGTKGVFRRHCPFGMLHVAGKRLSLYDLTPLRRTICDIFDASQVSKNGYKYGVGVTSWNTGKYRVVKHNDPKIEEYIYASCAQAMAFPPVKIDGEWQMDGGVRNAVPLRAALDAGAKNVLMVLTEATELNEIEGDPSSGFDVGLRTIEVLAHEVFNNDIELAMKDTDAKVLTVRPLAPLIADPLDFGKDQARRLIGRGYEDAAQQLGQAV